MRRPRGHISAFKSGARHQRVTAGDLHRYRLELVPMVDVVHSDARPEVAERLVSIVSRNSGIQKWLPGVAERYSTVESAEEAMKRAASRKDMIAWMIRRATGDPLDMGIDPAETIGVATMSENINVRDPQRGIGRYVLASYWTSQAPMSFEGAAIARSLLYETPMAVLRDPSRAFASIDGPVPHTTGELTGPFDPSSEFVFEGELWEGAVQLDGTKLQTADGIVTTPTTRLYRAKRT